MAELTWKKAIEKVLANANGAMHYKDIADAIITDGLRTTVGATPASTVSTILTTSIGRDGEKSPFQKVGRGEYVLIAKPNKPTSAGKPKAIKAEPLPIADTESQYEIISSFGMFWSRDFVDWKATPKLLGMQQIGAEPVDFNQQLGIYLLYDGREIIYVGRSTERPLGRRLYEHTVDRLATRWNRFSWFGLLPVSDSGKLGKLPDSFIAEKIIPAFEAVLIEALEPRQNRKRGDDLSAVEYLQREDPEIKRKIKKAILEDALSKVA